MELKEQDKKFMEDFLRNYGEGTLTVMRELQVQESARIVALALGTRPMTEVATVIKRLDTTVLARCGKGITEFPLDTPCLRPKKL